MNLEREELLQNIYARYIRGAAGEREVAKNMLIKILAKQDLTIYEYESIVFDNKVSKHKIIIPKSISMKVVELIIRYALSLLYDQDNHAKFYGYKRECYIDATKADYLEIQNIVTTALNAYKNEQKIQRKLFNKAFFAKNNFYVQRDLPPSSRKSKPLTPEERKALSGLIEGMSEVKIRKTLEDRSDF